MTYPGTCLFLIIFFFTFLPCRTSAEIQSEIVTDILYYDLQIKIDPQSKTLAGVNTISARTITGGHRILLKLSGLLSADSIVSGGANVDFTHHNDILEVSFDKPYEAGFEIILSIYYHGKPKEATNPPWNGGLVWEKDSLDRTWAGVTCEGEGAMVWWPCKDEWHDEPDSMSMSFIIPSQLNLISNGKFVSKQELDNGTTKHQWKVSYPINHYNVTFYLGNYQAFSDTLTSGGTKLSLDYYVLDYNLSKAKDHFKQTKIILSTFQTIFGPYPFPKDGYALVEAPYWGMEHQSAVAYGNNYKNNVLGMDFIIIHESAHEWWGNNISASDHAEMWIHEAFATYSEALLFENVHGKEKAISYLVFQRDRIQNTVPMLGPLNQNYSDWPDGDMYYKGSWMLHSLRNYIKNDSLWFSSLRKLQEDYKLSIITTEEVISFFSKETGKDLSPFFLRYLDFASPPELLYYLKKDKGKWNLYYRWDCNIKNFSMPFDLKTDMEYVLNGTTDWQKIELGRKKAKPDFTSTKFYYTVKKAVN